MAQINVQNLTFAYEGSYDNIFENVSFRLDTDWKLGFVGRNGRGKTTFLNLLTGRYEYSGKILTGAEFKYFPYDVPDKSVTTAAVIETLCGCQDWELRRELSLLQVAEEVLLRPFESLSNGEQTKVLLAALFLGESGDLQHFALIDEPTNHLDTHGREIVSRYLNNKAGFILVSHDRAFLDGCIDHVLSINRANIEVQRGNFSAWLANKERHDNFELAENAKLKKDIKRLKQAARQSGNWADKVESTKIGGTGAGGTGAGRAGAEKNIDSRAYIGEKSRRMQQRRKNLERRQNSAIEDKSKLLKNLERADALKITQLRYPKQLYLSLKDVTIFYGKNTVCQNISFDVRQGERIAIQGKNGSGKSSILRLIREQPPETTGGGNDSNGDIGGTGASGGTGVSDAAGAGFGYSGKLSVGSNLKISYVSQDTSGLSGSLTGYAARHGLDESLFKAILRKLDFARVQFEKDIRDFSGGQKKKVLIARSLCEQSHLLIWDEPLNYIDVLSRIQIEELLLAYKPTIIFVEHDSVFAEGIATGRVSI